MSCSIVNKYEELSGIVSRKGRLMVHQNRKTDRRVRRTEALLRGALSALVREKPYDEIVVKEILHRANVGRSTFYAHFGDKNELLQSCIHDILRSASLDAGQGATGSAERILRFSLPILDHIERHRAGGQVALAPEGQGAVHEQLSHAITNLIENEVTIALHRQRRSVGRPSASLLARWIASTFVLVLDWWARSESPLPAREAARLFRRLIEPSLSEALKTPPPTP